MNACSMIKMKDRAGVRGFLYCHHRRSFLTILFIVNLWIAAFVSATLLFFNPISGSNCSTRKKYSRKIEYSLTCSPAAANATPTCPASNFPAEVDDGDEEGPTCPEYFRWIHEDLWPWRETGITPDMVEAATKRNAFFRLVVVNGTAYVDTFKTTYMQTRESFTQWGILQLLRFYPGKIPDLDVVFNLGDSPSVRREFYPKGGAMAPPPLFGYDGDDFTFSIVFPDWSFWGWPDTQIKPWELLSKELKEGNKRSRWIDRDTHAYWKGNPKMSQSRRELLKCNASEKQNTNALIYAQDWNQEVKLGFKNSNLADQCNHRYKIYIEGIGWSVSQKYILACDSPTLLVKPRFYDFFSRGLVPLKHYWPIRVDDKCRSIKHAVDWGNSNPQEAQALGKAGSSFIQEELQMKYIYDFMFHILTAYAKLLRYKPRVPPNAVKICPEYLVCAAEGLKKQYMMESAVMASSDRPPCTMLPPYDPPMIRSFLEQKEASIKQVETWEKQYWAAQNTRKLNLMY